MTGPLTLDHPCDGFPFEIDRQCGFLMDMLRQYCRAMTDDFMCKGCVFKFLSKCFRLCSKSSQV